MSPHQRAEALKSINAFVEQANCFIEAAEDRAQRDMDVTLGRLFLLGAKIAQHLLPEPEDPKRVDADLKRSTYVGVGTMSRKR